MNKVAREKIRVKIKGIFRLNILPKIYITLGFILLFIIIGKFLPFIADKAPDVIIEKINEIPFRYIEPLIAVPILLLGIYVFQIFISLLHIVKLVLFGEKIIPFNDLNSKENLFKYKGKNFSGEAFKEKNNVLTDEFIFKKGKKISHIKIFNNGNVEFEEQWYYKGINPHPEGKYRSDYNSATLDDIKGGAFYEVSSKQIIVNRYKTWHKNRQLAQIYITYKNGKELEIRFDENGNKIDVAE